MRVFGKYALVYLLEGSGRMRVAGQPGRAVKAGDLLFVYPEIPHGYGPGSGEKWNEFYVVFSGPVFDLWRREGLLDPERPVRHLPRISRWLPRLEAAADPRLGDTPEAMLQRVCRLQKFLSDIAEHQGPTEVPVPWLVTARRRLMESPEVAPQAVARSLGISYETFRKDFARQTGHPPGRYRAVRLVEHARVLITERGLSNKEIAETLGFYDEFHFSRRFRQMTGQSPREFRRRLRG
jgi:AraC-like DNA-binding protein